MAVEFRTYLPYHKNVITTLQTITDDTPTFTTIIQLVISDNLPAGEYSLKVGYEWNMPDVNDSALFRIISPVTAGAIYTVEPKAADDSRYDAASFPLTWAGGPITLDLDASKTSGAMDLSVTYAMMEFERKT